PDQLEQLLGLLGPFLLGDRGVDPEGLLDLEPDGEDRVERGEGVLEDEADPPAPDAAQVLDVHGEEGAAVEDGGARLDDTRRGRGRGVIVNALPEPRSPTTPRNSPRFSLKLTSLTA